MAAGSDLPLRGTGPPHDPGRHLYWAGTRKSQACSSTLEFQAPRSSNCLHSFICSSQERWRTLRSSRPTLMENLADLFSECMSVFVEESRERDLLLSGENDLSQGPLKTYDGCDKLGISSNVFRFSPWRVESEPTKFGKAKQSSLIHEADVVFIRGDRPRSNAVVEKGLPEQLRRASNTAGIPPISDLVAIKPASGGREVKIRWLNVGNIADAVKNGFEDVASRSFQEEEFLALPGRLEAYQKLQSTDLKVPMGCLEGASRRPGRGTARGWEAIKAGMEKVLGRSILPARDAKGSYSLPMTFAAATKKTGRISESPSVVFERSSGGSVLSDSVGSVTRPRVGATEHVESSNRAEDIKQAPKPSLFSLRMGDNAVAGALAGTCVSLCLHPVDTVKTVIQAQSFGQRSVFHTLVAIISDRGVSGLYRGLGSNLASSAPISAIYTFTYESVKAALLPHLPKEYYALAHCTAGGCASIATSFIYTPSECVKQRMQVGCLYRNSWLAFVGILRNGGLSSLYSGWGAVLCRNVPQSVIKFYTYEGLKHYALTGHPVGTHLSTLQTLAFGGLAGSTAALFTTPFDVIKTRLQTQVPGSIMYQKGVLQAFQHIAASEGLGGLYRGLIPRLVIYVSQGALFFASYEFFKQVLAVEVRRLSLRTAQSHTQSPVSQATIIEST